jgi:hypothetical protein
MPTSSHMRSRRRPGWSRLTAAQENTLVRISSPPRRRPEPRTRAPRRAQPGGRPGGPGPQVPARRRSGTPARQRPSSIPAPHRRPARPGWPPAGRDPRGPACPAASQARSTRLNSWRGAWLLTAAAARAACPACGTAPARVHCRHERQLTNAPRSAARPAGGDLAAGTHTPDSPAAGGSSAWPRSRTFAGLERARARRSSAERALGQPSPILGAEWERRRASRCGQTR